MAISECLRNAVSTLVGIVFCAVLSPAAVIFDNTTGNTEVGTRIGFLEGYSNSFRRVSAFTPDADYYLTDAKIVAGVFPGSTDDRSSALDMYIFSDLGNRPGSPLATLGTDLVTSAYYPLSDLVIGNAPPHTILLQAGHQYWLVVAATINANWAAVWYDLANSQVPTAWDDTFAPSPQWHVTTDSPQFAVDGDLATPTPEPQLMVPTVLLSGCLILGYRRRGIK